MSQTNNTNMIDLFKTNITNLFNNCFSKLVTQTIQSTDLQDNIFSEITYSNILPPFLVAEFIQFLFRTFNHNCFVEINNSLCCAPRNFSFPVSGNSGPHSDSNPSEFDPGEHGSTCWICVPNLQVPNVQTSLPYESSTVNNRIIRCRTGR